MSVFKKFLHFFSALFFLLQGLLLRGEVEQVVMRVLALCGRQFAVAALELLGEVFFVDVIGVLVAHADSSCREVGAIRRF